MATHKRSSTRENVKVVARIRPTNEKEISSGGVPCVKYSNSLIEVNHDNDSANSFSFDRIFGPESAQVDVFEFAALPLISDVLTGYNATIFAYGQTGTGKTHTMEGEIHSEINKGIIPRSVEGLFNGVLEADENIEFTFKVSYVEIYMEKIRDLLDDSRVKTNLNVREDKVGGKGIYIAGVTEVYVTSHEELLGIMSTGSMNRATAATGMNEGSSRSHSVFTITVNQRNLGNNTTTTGKLVLVDLAGSEMVRKSNASGQQLEEAKTINKSLSALGQVIMALTSKEEKTHVPYRDSKLTRILQDSLGGNAKTVLIVAVSPSSYNASETISTLRFGTRAKSIENKVTVNQTRSVEELEALLLRAEKAIDIQAAHISTLTAQMEAYQIAVGDKPVINASEKNGIENDNMSNEALNVALAAAKAAEASRLEAEIMMQSLQEQINSLTTELEEEKLESVRKDNEASELNRLLREKESLLGEAGELLQEAQNQYVLQKDSNEKLFKDKTDQFNELETLKSQMTSEIDKLVYDMKEKELKIETLYTENKHLQQEIAEMSGDYDNQHGGKAKDRPIVAGGGSTTITTTTSAAIISGSDSQTDMTLTSKPLVESASVTSMSATNTSAVSDIRASIATVTVAAVPPLSRDALDQDILTELMTICQKYDISSNITHEISEMINIYVTSRLNLLLIDYEARIHRDKQMILDYNRKLQDSHSQRSRLENDLSDQLHKFSKILFDLDVLKGMDGISKTEYFTNRERANSRSLQQRLEQLVVVHRQLLRKFASMELENSEYKKKIILRDERIKQLETSGRALVGTMRQQAERHVNELTYLREQVQLARSEYTMRLENTATGIPNTTRGENSNTIGRDVLNNPSNKLPHEGQIRTLRGGGHHVEGVATNSNTGNLTVNNGSGGTGGNNTNLTSVNSSENKVIRGGLQKGSGVPLSPKGPTPLITKVPGFSVQSAALRYQDQVVGASAPVFVSKTSQQTTTPIVADSTSNKDSVSVSDSVSDISNTENAANSLQKSNTPISASKVAKSSIFSRLLGQNP